ncbi:signal peptidase I [Thermococcus sp.]|uniref:signal peptidase I n=1 Tax=Thermococcus sp. TaxID=35749 RepID=UPI002625C231|nr:signal peptidase I [Thermococcus sp.]
MSLKGVLGAVATVLLLSILLVSAGGFLIGRPVFMSYTYSESMTPAINKGDLFFINPLSKGGKTGDIIVFHRRDGWTVHRIFVVTDGGYITKGDNNVATDQQNGENPIVERSDVIGKVVELAGSPLVIRGGGAFIESFRARLSNVYAVVIFLVVGSFLTFLGGDKRRPVKRARRRRYIRVRAKTLYAALSVLIIAGFLFVTVASWGVLTFTYSSTLAGGQREGWHLPGSTFERNLSLRNGAVYPFHYFIETGERAEILNGNVFDIPGRGTRRVLLRVFVPKETRVYRGEVRVHAYPAILPGGVVALSYRASPYLPLVLYALELAAVLLAFYRLAAIGSGELIRIRIRRRGILGRIIGDGW